MAGSQGKRTTTTGVDKMEWTNVLDESILGAMEPQRLLELFYAMLESAPDALIVIDTDGQIVFANDQTSRLFGYSPGALLGQRVEVLVPQRFREDHPKHRDRYIRNPHFRPMGAGLELYGTRNDGTEFPIEISLSPIHFQDRMLVAAAMRDATDRKNAERARQLATSREEEIKRLEQESKFKAHLLNLVSHELNTPITPLKVQLHLLKKRLADEDYEEADHGIEILQRNMDRLANLVTDILDVSRLEAGRLKMRRTDVDLGVLLAHTKESFEGSKNQDGKPVKVILDVQEGADLWVYADPDRIQQVLDNLVANAIRLSPDAGEVRLCATAGRDWVKVDIQDEGPGLSPENINNLFKPFSQVHGKETDRTGTGLGLYVSRGIVDNHGGTLEASSLGEGKGATFTMVLKKGRPADPEPQDVQQDPVEA